MKRKLLFLIFTDEVCKLYHSIIYALDLKENGHQVKIILEGLSTKKIKEICEENEDMKALLMQLREHDLLIGACKAASHGCGSSKSDVPEWMRDREIRLLEDLDGHAGITYLVEQGYEIVTF